MARFAVLIFAIGALASAHGAKIVYKEGRPCEITFERNYECSLSNVGLRVRPSNIRACQCIDQGWMRCEQTNRACISPSAIQAALNAAKQPVLVIAAAEQDQAKEDLGSTAVSASGSDEPAREDPTEQIVAAVMEVMAESEPAKEASSAPEAEPQQEVAPAEPEAVVPEPAKESPNPEPAPQVVAEPEPAQEVAAAAEPAKETAETEPAKKAAEPEETVEHEPAKETAETEPAKETAESEPAKETAETEPARETAETEPAKETAEPEPVKKSAEPEPAKEVAASEPAQEQSAPAEPALPAAAAETQSAEPAKELAENAPSVMIESMEVEIIPKLETAASIPIYHISPIVNADDLEKQRLAIELAGENYIYFAGYNDEERIR